MRAAWKHHGTAVGLLAVVGGLSLRGMLRFEEMVPGTLGTHAFGYGALVLLAVALSIGPVARLWPKRLSVLLPYRRAVGIWSAVAGVVHFLFVLQLVSYKYYERDIVTLFFQDLLRYTPSSGHTHYVPNLLDHLSMVAWTGLVGLLIMVGIALVSNDRVQRFLGASAWKLIQQQAYAAFMVIAMHIFLMRFGGKLKLSPQLYWWVPWLPLAVAVLQLAGFIYTVRRHRSRTADAKPPAKAG